MLLCLIDLVSTENLLAGRGVELGSGSEQHGNTRLKRPGRGLQGKHMGTESQQAPGHHGPHPTHQHDLMRQVCLPWFHR